MAAPDQPQSDQPTSAPGQRAPEAGEAPQVFGGPPPPTFSTPPGYETQPAPPGYGAPPAYGAPPGYSYGTPPPGPGWPAAPDQRPTNRLAIFSLVLGILTPCGGLPGLLSVVFGIVSLSQIKKKGERGTGLAVGGIAATGVWLVVIALVVAAVAFSPGPGRDGAGEITSEGRISTDELSIGDCIADLPEGTRILRVTGVPCSEPHIAQVYAIFDLPAMAWPGEEEVFAQADDVCIDTLAAFPAAFDDPTVEVMYLHPTRASWRLGDREVVCLAEYTGGPRTGSLFD
jgi:hypothetical protein